MALWLKTERFIFLQIPAVTFKIQGLVDDNSDFCPMSISKIYLS